MRDVRVEEHVQQRDNQEAADHEVVVVVHRNLLSSARLRSYCLSLLWGRPAVDELVLLPCLDRVVAGNWGTGLGYLAKSRWTTLGVGSRLVVLVFARSLLP